MNKLKSKREERTRKERKARYIHVKNLMRKYPECNYDDLFYCDYVYDPANPWVWTDFRFFHTTLKRYFAVAMVTAEYEAYSEIENNAIEQSAIMFPYPELMVSTHRMREGEVSQKRDELRQKLIDERLEQPQFVRPSILVKDYGPVAIGLWVTVNKDYIDEHVIKEFITFFRSLGEPIKAGWNWSGEETKVDPKRLTINKAT